MYDHKTRLTTCNLDMALTVAVWRRLLAYADVEWPALLSPAAADCQLVSIDLNTIEIGEINTLDELLNTIFGHSSNDVDNDGSLL